MIGVTVCVVNTAADATSLRSSPPGSSSHAVSGA
jgi:hypothetical protein